MADLFNPALAPEIIKATEELREQLGPLHAAAVRVGGIWSSIRQAVNKAQSAGSIKKYMEILLETRDWDGGDELLKRLRLHLNGGRIANWQLIAREHAAGIDYYVFPTLRDLIQDESHWGLGLTEAQLKAFVEPEEPSLWARIEAAIHHAQPPGRKGEGEMYDIYVMENRASPEYRQQARSRALARALEIPELRQMYDDQMVPKTVATVFGSVSKDPEHEALKASCLEQAFAAYSEAKTILDETPMAGQGKAVAAAKKAVREALAPVKCWQPKPLGAVTGDDWAFGAAELLVESYSADDLIQLVNQLQTALSLRSHDL